MEQDEREILKYWKPKPGETYKITAWDSFAMEFVSDPSFVIRILEYKFSKMREKF